MMLASLALAVAAMALLALSIHRHAVSARLALEQRRPAAMRFAGWVMLLFSCAADISDSGWRLGLIEWIGQLAPCAAAITLLLTNRPTMLPRVPVPALMIALVAAWW